MTDVYGVRCMIFLNQIASAFTAACRGVSERNRIAEFLAGKLPRRLRRGNFHTGFTLLEILVAVSVFSIIALALFGTFRTVYGRTGRIAKRIRCQEMAGTCINRMMSDLAAIRLALPPAYRKPETRGSPDPFRLAGKRHSIGARTFPVLRFVSRGHTGFGTQGQGGVAEIVYYVERTQEDRYVLRRSDRFQLEEPFAAKDTDPILCDRVQSMTVTYHDKSGRSHDRWDSDSEEFGYATPRSVAFELEIGADAEATKYRTMILLPVSRDGAG